MEMTIEQALALMDTLFAQRDWTNLAGLAGQFTQQFPKIPTAWRYLGIVKLLSGQNDSTDLQHALSLGDTDAQVWSSVINGFKSFAEETILPHHILQQVDLAYLSRSHYLDFPTEVHIETQAICNAACSFCPYPTMDRKGDKMSESLIDKIIADLTAIPHDLPFTISPFKVSDPFLDKRIFSVCEKINQQLPNAKLRLFTNGSPLTEKMLDKIAKIENVIHLWISLNEYQPAAYEQTMQLPFAKTIEKMDVLHRRVEKGYPHAVVISRVCDDSVEDASFKKFIEEHYPLFSCFLIGRSDWTGQIDIHKQKAISPTGCGRWYEVSIMASGKVALCCMDGEGKHVVGDVNQQSVLEIYNSPSYRNMREHAFSRLAAPAPCNVCIY